MFAFALLVFIPLFGFSAFLVIFQQRFILPARVNSVTPPDAALHFEQTTLATADGHTLHGIVFLPTRMPVRELVLVFPGNSHNPIGFAEFVKTQVYNGQDDVAIAAFSYRGYPNGITPPSTGTPSQKVLFADAELIYDAMVQRFTPQKVKVVAYSIGTAVAAHLATVRPIDAMALAAPIASVRRIAQQRYPWLPVSLLLRHPFATEDIFAGIETPTTLIYSPTDGLVPVEHITQVLHRLNPRIPLVAVEHTNHVSLALSPRLPELVRQALERTADTH